MHQPHWLPRCSLDTLGTSWLWVFVLAVSFAWYALPPDISTWLTPSPHLQLFAPISTWQLGSPWSPHLKLLLTSPHRCPQAHLTSTLTLFYFFLFFLQYLTIYLLCSLFSACSSLLDYKQHKGRIPVMPIDGYSKHKNSTRHIVFLQ